MSTPAVRGPFSEEVFRTYARGKGSKQGSARVRVSLHPTESRGASTLCQVVNNGHFLWFIRTPEMQKFFRSRKWPKLSTWDSPWGFDVTDEPPQDMFTNQLEMEGFLQLNAVFVHGLHNTSAHMDSYLTIVDLEQLNKVTQLLADTYRPLPSEWQHILDAWTTNPNTQNCAMLVATHWAARFGLTLKTYNKEDWHR